MKECYAVTGPGLNSDTLALQPRYFHAMTAHQGEEYDQNEQGRRQAERRKAWA